MSQPAKYTMILVTLVALATKMADHGVLAEQEAVAAQSDYALSVSCVDPVVVSFAPDVTYTMTMPAGTRDTAASPAAVTISGSLTNPINSDGNPTVTQVGGNTGKFIKFYNRGPYVKIGGVQCTTNSSATLAIYGDGANDTQYDIAFQSTASTNWNSSNQVDQLTSGNAAMLFGNSGLLSNSPLNDGSDADGIVNGEIAFGGDNGTPSYRIFNSVQYLNTSTLSHSETLTYVFTPQ